MSSELQQEYNVPITRANPTCQVILVDQSSSMIKPFGGQPEKKKADGVADAINRMLQTLCIRCGRADGVHEYFHIGVIGYGRTVGSALGGALANRGLVKISEIAANPLRVEVRNKAIDDGAGGILQQKLKFPIWFESKADGTTPMRQAVELANEWVSGFLAQFPKCFPPIVINLTDGAADKGQDPSAAADALRKLRSTNGRVLFFNAHISERTDPSVRFPADEQRLPSDFAKQLFRMSSVLPPPLLFAARAEEFDVQEGSRGFVFNADLVDVIRFLDIGTRTSTGIKET